MNAPVCSYGETLLKVEDVSQVLGGRQILRNVDLEICNLIRPGHTQGQVVGLLGPSGMGKTRLFRILAGLDQPDTGTVRLGVEGKPVERGSVGVVAQNCALFEHRTVLGNIVVAGRRARLSVKEARDKGRRCCGASDWRTICASTRPSFRVASASASPSRSSSCARSISCSWTSRSPASTSTPRRG